MAAHGAYGWVHIAVAVRSCDRHAVRLPLLDERRLHPNAAPAFAARILPVLAKDDEKEDGEQTLHPTLHRLIDEFGEREEVLSGIASNIGTYSWTGSMTGYYQRFLAPLDALAGHCIAAVRLWAARMTRELQGRIESARDHDAELDAEWEM